MLSYSSNGFKPARGGGNAVVFPEISRFKNPFAVLVADPDAARYLPRGAEAFVGVAEAAANPALTGLLDVKVHRAALGTRVAEEYIVVLDIDLARRAPLVEESGPFQHGILFMWVLK